MSVIIGSLIEAWTQLRISKLRVLLSLVGVAASVAAMTFVIALGQVSVIVIQNEMARYSGYPGTVTVQINPAAVKATPLTKAKPPTPTARAG